MPNAALFANARIAVIVWVKQMCLGNRYRPDRKHTKTRIELQEGHEEACRQKRVQIQGTIERLGLQKKQAVN